ncbi:MAG: tetratricopeptide repeat protein [Deltaproteobacteria bacterium]|nr:tetratricopeptide repeat protein [Deltaproteobacteria bacterium]
MTDQNVVQMGPPWRRYLHRGIEALRAGHPQAALSDLERAHHSAPDEPDVLLALGRAKVSIEAFDEAAKLFERALSLAPQSLAATALLARVLGLHLDRQQDALTVLRDCSAPDAAPLQVVRGEILLEAGDITAARTAFARALDHDLSDDAARTGLARTFNAEGIALSDRGAHEKAIFSFKRAADLDPGWSAPLVNQGVAFGRMGKLSKAAEAYGAALARDAQNPVAMFNLGVAHQELGSYSTAIDTLEELLAFCPNYPQGRACLAACYLETGHFDRAIALLLEELDFNPADASCWSTLGSAYVFSGNAERGEQCLRRALGLDAKLVSAQLNLATLCATQGRAAEARKWLEEAMRLAPERTAQALKKAQHFSALRGLLEPSADATRPQLS